MLVRQASGSPCTPYYSPLVLQGPDSELVLALSFSAIQVSQFTTVAEQEAYQQMSDANAVPMGFFMMNPLGGTAQDHSIVLEDIPTAKAVNGIATFDLPVGLLPSVWITNTSTGAPYVPGQTIMDEVGFSHQMQASSSVPGKAQAADSNKFFVFRTLQCPSSAFFSLSPRLPQAHMNAATLLRGCAPCVHMHAWKHTTWVSMLAL